MIIAKRTTEQGSFGIELFILYNKIIQNIKSLTFHARTQKRAGEINQLKT